MEASDNRLIVACLIGVVISLLAVGFVSGTILRHIVQVLPAAVATVAVARTGSGRYMALAIFTFWLVITALIWLFLLGIAKVLNGHFTGVEIALTIVIGFSCATGAWKSLRGSCSEKMGTAAGALVFIVALIVQIAVLWLSFQPQIARD